MAYQSYQSVVRLGNTDSQERVGYMWRLFDWYKHGECYEALFGVLALSSELGPSFLTSLTIKVFPVQHPSSFRGYAPLVAVEPLWANRLMEEFCGCCGYILLSE